MHSGMLQSLVDYWHLLTIQACKTCDSYGSTSCSTEGQDGPGVADADIVVYVAARDFGCVGSLPAYATHCFQDRSTDRYTVTLSLI